jgi:hypothetical protein
MAKSGRKTEDVAKAKVKFLEIWEQGQHSFEEVAAEIDVHPATVWRWRRNDEEFAEAFEDLRVDVDAQQVVEVERSLYRRAVDGHPTSMIFFLCNRAPGRWQHVNKVEVTGKDGGPVQIDSMRQVLRDKLAMLAANTDGDDGPGDGQSG